MGEAGREVVCGRVESWLVGRRLAAAAGVCCVGRREGGQDHCKPPSGVDLSVLGVDRRQGGVDEVC